MKFSHIAVCLFLGVEALAEVFTKLHPDGSIAEVRKVSSDPDEKAQCKKNKKQKKKEKCKNCATTVTVTAAPEPTCSPAGSPCTLDNYLDICCPNSNNDVACSFADAAYTEDGRCVGDEPYI